MTRTVTLGFENNCMTIPVTDILPVRVLGKSVKSSRKYVQITASIREVGLVEPPVVTRNAGEDGSWLLLDGHIRIEVLKDLGIEQIECLISTEDEAFTYNKRISRLAPIQEHRMNSRPSSAAFRKRRSWPRLTSIHRASDERSSCSTASALRQSRS